MEMRTVMLFTVALTLATLLDITLGRLVKRIVSKGNNIALNIEPNYTFSGVKKSYCFQFCFYRPQCQLMNLQQISTNDIYQCDIFLMENAKVSFYENEMIKYTIKRSNSKIFAVEILQDCLSYRQSGFINSGIYEVSSDELKAFKVWCDMEDEDGGWNVLLRRTSDGQPFDKNWTEYKEGFGDLDKSHWLGNEKIYFLTNMSNVEAKIELIDENDVSHVVKYFTFKVESEIEKYRLTIGDYFNLEDGFLNLLSHFNGTQFSTFDDGSDNESQQSCPSENGGGGWWFALCRDNYMTGLYMESAPSGNTWGPSMKIKYSILKIRRNFLLSQGKPVSVSSTHSSPNIIWSQENINDGKIEENGVYYCWHNAVTTEQPWLTIDLIKIAQIVRVRIYNRVDCCKERLNSLEIYAMYTPEDKMLCANLSNANSQPIVNIPCTKKTKGRIVKVVKNSSFVGNGNILNICEVQVFGIYDNR